MLQTRNGKRTAAAALKFSMDMVKEKLIDWETAILRNPADQLEQLLAPIFDLARSRRPRPSPPAFRPVRVPPPAKSTSTPTAPHRRERGEKVLLVRNETPRRSSRHDRRRRHSHRQRRCLPTPRSSPVRWARSASAVQLPWRSTTTRKTVTVAGQTFREGDFLSIDGTSGIVYGGQIKTAPSKSSRALHGDKAAQGTEKFKSFQQLMNWCGQGHRLQVRTNADNPEQTENAIAFGATGHRPHPHRAHVLRRRPHRRRCAR
jgi:pyruvate,orthophosphate dikinase